MTRTKKKKKTKPSEKPPFKYVTEDYCPRVLVFRRLNDNYGEHPKAKPYQYVLIDGNDDNCSMYIPQDSYGAEGWLLERVHIDDTEE